MLVTCTRIKLPVIESPPGSSCALDLLVLAVPYRAYSLRPSFIPPPPPVQPSAHTRGRIAGDGVMGYR